MNKETLTQLKSSAKTIGRELESLGYPAISHTHLLQVLSKSVGFETWNAMRAAATSHAPAPAAPPTAVRPYSPSWVAATYNANGRSVEVVRWEDPVLGLGDWYYVYDAETFQCLTPTLAHVFNVRDVPDYETIVTLLDQLANSHRCTVCGYMGDEFGEEEFDDHQACLKDGCTGEMLPFFKS